MTGKAQPELPTDVESRNDATPISGALVPLATPAEQASTAPLPRPDPSFVAQLIATAEHAPQTRPLRRGSYADAQAAYGPHPGERRSVTRRTRQVI
jgi:hypothetical protein